MNLENMPNHQIVSIAVAILGGEISSIDREDVAVKANELSPGRFTWRKYPENIDLDAVGTALRGAKKEKNGALLVGNNVEGWMLSPAGLQWFKSLDLEGILGPRLPNYRRDSMDANLSTERNRLKATNAFKLFTEDKPELLTLQDFYQFARVNEYYQTNTRKRRYSIIENAVEGDTMLINLWMVLKEKFKEEMV